MKEKESRMCRGQGSKDTGFTLIEILITVGVIGILAGIAMSSFQTAVRKARRNALIADGKILYDAFLRYHMDHNEYPPCCSPASERFNLVTLHPLTRDGYLSSGTAITNQLRLGTVSAYDSPDNPSPNADFYAWLESRRDPTVEILVADTDELPGYSGQILNGVYLVQGTALVSISDLR